MYLCTTVHSMRCLYGIDGLPPATAAKAHYATVYSKVSYGIGVCMVDPHAYFKRWMQVLRALSGSYRTTHTTLLLREFGLLFHPLWWIARDYISFWKKTKELSVAGDVTSTILVNIVDGEHHPLRQQVEKALKITGITWPDIISRDRQSLLRHARSMDFIIHTIRT